MDTKKVVEFYLRNSDLSTYEIAEKLGVPESIVAELARE